MSIPITKVAIQILTMYEINQVVYNSVSFHYEGEMISYKLYIPFYNIPEFSTRTDIFDRDINMFKKHAIRNN